VFVDATVESWGTAFRLKNGGLTLRAGGARAVSRRGSILNALNQHSCHQGQSGC